MSISKRFIAGAVCPRCAIMDRIVVFQENGHEVRECVECGYTDSMAAIGSPAELPTRVNQANASSQPASQPLKFYPNPKRKSKQPRKKP
ncbi:YheV family putative metal-binding protein [Endozoicomonas sp. SM1973]|uniref:YheV family putative metal-binding protein n=1 Tax=Spartinivicinus marinus TaxID=2994442 RepID=A0A853IAU6_9GAMM|nr:YheV family putative zinc ribbon protein [Spartinivicinus marinus]MCX4026712.1 YheV family putative metal-binding protein [Spartinivicinus marinus]NYZ64546.1 YheV family putative metal-binding protein [Spartinivicinus marinus]